MPRKMSFNINVELYENFHGELALRFPGEKVYREVGQEARADFIREATEMIRSGDHPQTWRDMPAHQLLYGHGWHCIGRLGFIDGDENRPAVEFEEDPERIGDLAKTYLKRVLH